MQDKTPIAVFVYNRPQHTERMLSSLANCSRLSECQIIIFSDAPRIADHNPAVQEVRSMVRAWARANGAEVVERSENLGLAHSIVGGVTRLCNENGRVIVVEDDLILHPAFVHFMLSALDHYQDEECVAQVSGYMFPVRHAGTPDAFFLPYTTSWGWAVWDRAWRLFNWQPDISSLEDTHTQFLFNHGGVTNHAAMLRDCLAGRNQSWAILYFWAVFCAEKHVLFPRISLVQNIGFDGSGIHYARRQSIKERSLLAYERWLSGRLSNQAAWLGTSKFIWPDKIEICEAAYSRISAYRSARADGLISYFKNQLLTFQNIEGRHEIFR